MAATHPAKRADPVDEGWVWLEQRYREHRSQLYRFALGVLRNREDAEDAMQITLLNAHRALARGERPLRPRAWLFAISLNVCRRLLQTRARRPLPLVTDELQAPLRTDEDATGAEISHAVASLPPEQREIFLLRELQGLSFAEVGERLGLSRAAAESRLARARRKLREQLAPEEIGGRRPLFGIPGFFATLRASTGPGALKLAGVIGAIALAPAVTIGLSGDRQLPSRADPPAVVTPATGVVFTSATEKEQASISGRPAGLATRRRSASPAGSAARTSVRPPRAKPQAAGSTHRGSTSGAEAQAGAVPPNSVAQQAAGGTAGSSSAARQPTQGRPTVGAAGRERAKAPAPGKRVTDVVDDAVALVQGAVNNLPVPTVSVPSVTTPSVTTPSVTTPSVTTPSVTTPSGTVPSVTVPSVTVPSVTAPTVTVPSASVPSVTAPTVTVPTVTVPTVTVPTVTVPPPPVP